MVLLSLGPDQWLWFWTGVAVIAPILIACQIFVVDPRSWGPIGRALDPANADNPSAQRAGFAAIMLFPRHTLVWGTAWWLFGGALLALMLHVAVGVSAYSAVVILCAAGSGGLVSVIFHAYFAKRMFRDARDLLARRVGNPDVRERLVRPVRLGAKLVFCITGVTVVTLVFAIFLAQVRASRAVERGVVLLQDAALDQLVDEVARAPAGRIDLVDAPARFQWLSEETRFLRLDAEASRVLAGDAGGLARPEQVSIAQSYESHGNGLGLDSPNVFSWRRLPMERGVIVAYLPWSAVQTLYGDLNLVFVGLLFFATAIAFGVAVALADDIGQAIQMLRAEAARVASGDLTQGSVFESEDELGDLARSFARMSQSLRATVGRVVEAADGVEGAASEIASVGDNVAGVTVDQMRGIQEATSSMERISAQVHGIADTAQALNDSIDESSSSVAELGAIGDQLSANAAVLSEKVAQSSTSTEEMIRSVRNVGENAEQLFRAATDTSSSIEEMAASMREVATNAGENVNLSDSVVATAEGGREKVLQTVRGMEAIRAATESAHSVIHGLGARVSEIGAVVEVIDDVADETNLLALNAAIIAAQAGEHGRSFSVVADQIKELADRVLASTKEIDGQIRVVQHESANAIGAIERGTESVQEGVDLSAQAGEALEEITRVARQSGARITEIVKAVQEQTAASSGVAELMERVRGGVEQISAATREQERANNQALEGCATMREVSEQVRTTTEEQARGSRRIGDSVESVREAIDQINRALQAQTEACRRAMETLAQVNQRTGSNEESTARMGEAMRALMKQAETLREGVERFRV